ncbi:MAG: broad specificity phosphatase PhoE [Candidatus Omnitrophota bacterium]
MGTVYFFDVDDYFEGLMLLINYLYNLIFMPLAPLRVFNKPNSPLRAIALALALVLMLEPMVLAAGDVNVTQSIILPKHPIQLTLLESTATIVDAYTAISSKAIKAPTIILIEDAHVNPSAQKNIAKAIESIVQQTGIETVFAEAAFGDNSLNEFRSHGSPLSRTRLGDQLINNSEINGSEYASLTTPLDFKIIGVEDPSLYAKSLDVYKSIVQTRKDLDAYLNKIKTTLNYLKPKIINDTLNKFDSLRLAYTNQEIALTVYFDQLIGYAQSYDLDLEAYAELNQMQSIHDFEKSIDFNLANDQISLALNELSPVERNDLNQIKSEESKLKKLHGFKDGHSSYYVALKKIILSKDPTQAKYDELNKYFEYLHGVNQINAQLILEEQRSLEEAVINAMTRSVDEKRLLDKQSELDILFKLIDLQLSPSEYEHYQTMVGAKSLVSMIAFMNQLLMPMSADYQRVLLYKSEYEQFFAKAEQFYVLAHQRDVKFVENIREHSAKHKISQSIFISGGFHTPHMKILLKQNQISYIQVRPNVLSETNHQRYEELLLNQSINSNKFTQQTQTNSSHMGVLHRVSRDNWPQFRNKILRELGGHELVGRTSTGLNSEANPSRMVDRADRVDGVVRESKVLQAKIMGFEVIDEEAGWIDYSTDYITDELDYELAIIAHGNTQNNLDGVFHGLTDNKNSVVLDQSIEDIWKGAKAWWLTYGQEYIQSPDNFVFITSPLRRTDQTFQVYKYYIEQRLTEKGITREISAIVDVGVREINLGSWDGLTIEEVRAKHGDLEYKKALAFRSGDVFVKPGLRGEAFVDVLTRTRNWMLSKNEDYAGKLVFVFGHGIFENAASIVQRNKIVELSDKGIDWRYSQETVGQKRGLVIPINFKDRKLVMNTQVARLFDWPALGSLDDIFSGEINPWLVIKSNLKYWLKWRLKPEEIAYRLKSINVSDGVELAAVIMRHMEAYPKILPSDKQGSKRRNDITVESDFKPINIEEVARDLREKISAWILKKYYYQLPERSLHMRPDLVGFSTPPITSGTLYLGNSKHIANFAPYLSGVPKLGIGLESRAIYQPDIEQIANYLERLTPLKKPNARAPRMAGFYINLLEIIYVTELLKYQGEEDWYLNPGSYTLFRRQMNEVRLYAESYFTKGLNLSHDDIRRVLVAINNTERRIERSKSSNSEFKNRIAPIEAHFASIKKQLNAVAGDDRPASALGYGDETQTPEEAVAVMHQFLGFNFVTADKQERQFAGLSAEVIERLDEVDRDGELAEALDDFLPDMYEQIIIFIEEIDSGEADHRAYRKTLSSSAKHIQTLLKKYEDAIKPSSKLVVQDLLEDLINVIAHLRIDQARARMSDFDAAVVELLLQSKLLTYQNSGHLLLSDSQFDEYFEAMQLFSTRLERYISLGTPIELSHVYALLAVVDVLQRQRLRNFGDADQYAKNAEMVMVSESLIELRDRLNEGDHSFEFVGIDDRARANEIMSHFGHMRNVALRILSKTSTNPEMNISTVSWADEVTLGVDTELLYFDETTPINYEDMIQRFEERAIKTTEMLESAYEDYNQGAIEALQVIQQELVTILTYLQIDQIQSRMTEGDAPTTGEEDEADALMGSVTPVDESREAVAQLSLLRYQNVVPDTKEFAITPPSLDPRLAQNSLSLIKQFIFGTLTLLAPSVANAQIPLEINSAVGIIEARRVGEALNTFRITTNPAYDLRFGEFMVNSKDKLSNRIESDTDEVSLSDFTLDHRQVDYQYQLIEPVDGRPIVGELNLDLLKNLDVHDERIEAFLMGFVNQFIKEGQYVRAYGGNDYLRATTKKIAEQITTFYQLDQHVYFDTLDIKDAMYVSLDKPGEADASDVKHLNIAMQPYQGNSKTIVNSISIANMMLATGKVIRPQIDVSSGLVYIDSNSIPNALVNMVNTLYKSDSKIRAQQVGWILMANQKAMDLIIKPLNIARILSFIQFTRRQVEVMA